MSDRCTAALLSQSSLFNSEQYETARQKSEAFFFLKHWCLSDLSLCFSAVQGVEMVNGALWGRPRVGEDLEDVKIVAQGVCSDQQHSCRGGQRQPAALASALTQSCWLLEGDRSLGLTYLIITVLLAYPAFIIQCPFRNAYQTFLFSVKLVEHKQSDSHHVNHII